MSDSDSDTSYNSDYYEFDELDSLLIDASENGYINEVKRLLKKGASVNFEREYRYEDEDYAMSALMASANNGHTKIVELLLDKEADTEIKNNYFHTALSLASSKGYTEIVKLLLKAGANTEGGAEKGQNYCDTPLENAIRNWHDEIAEILIKAGANINNCNDDKYSILDIALECENKYVCKLLIDAGVIIAPTMLIQWSYVGNLNAVEFLLENGADPHATGKLLHWWDEDTPTVCALDVICKLESKYRMHALSSYYHRKCADDILANKIPITATFTWYKRRHAVIIMNIYDY